VQKELLVLFLEGKLSPADLDPGKGNFSICLQLSSSITHSGKGKKQKGVAKHLSLKTQLMVLEYIGGWSSATTHHPSTKETSRSGAIIGMLFKAENGTLARALEVQKTEKENMKFSRQQQQKVAQGGSRRALSIRMPYPTPEPTPDFLQILVQLDQKPQRNAGEAS
jgi:hypothetical protein